MRNKHQRAFLQLEAITALCMMTFVVGALAAAILGLARSSHALISRQQATLAAEAVLNELRSGDVLTEDEIETRFGDMNIRIERTSATGDFDGLDRAVVHVDALTHGRITASVRLCGFVKTEATE